MYISSPRMRKLASVSFNVVLKVEAMSLQENSKDEKDISFSSEGTFKMSYNIDADELDQETVSKLKGDSIGDTLYSQSFVLNTLLNLSDLKWDLQFENDLCFLWDMSVERDVCNYLIDISYTSIACNIIVQYSDNNRLIEILVGILANIFSLDCVNTMTKDEFKVVLNNIQSDDPLILIQLMRFISATSENEVLLENIDQDFFEKICFILENALNSELLVRSLDAVSKLTSDFKMKEQFINYNFYTALITGYKTVTKTQGAYIELENKQILASVTYLLKVLVNIYLYIEHFKKKQLHTEFHRNSDIILKEFIKILHFYSFQENMFPVTDNFVYSIATIKFIIINLELPYIAKLFMYVTNIFEQFIEIKSEFEDLFQDIIELECYLLTSTHKDTIYRDLKGLSIHTVKKVLKTIQEEKHNALAVKCCTEYLLEFFK